MEQHELQKGPLLDDTGNPIESGFAYSLVKDYDRNAIKARQSRIKEWDYYYFGNHEVGIAITIDDNSYMDLCSVTLFDYRKKVYYEKSRMHFFTFGKHGFPSTSKTGDVSYRDKAVDITFHNKDGDRLIEGFYHGYKDKKDLTFRLKISEVRDATMVIVTPFLKKRHFYYNQKINNLVAEGEIRLGEETYEVRNMSGVLDWGRGVWTRINTWYWASMNDRTEDGTPIGFNLGYGFGDTSKASENMFFFGDKAYKLQDVRFEIPKGKNGKEDYDLPWRMTSEKGDIQLTFTPLIHRRGGGNAIFIHSIQNQIFGLYDGFIKIGETVHEIRNCSGFAEKVYNRW